MRLFFALWPDRDVCEAIRGSTRELVRYAGGRAVPPERMHMTLVFLGEVDEARLPVLETVGAQVAAEATPFRMDLVKPGVFPRPGVLWLAPELTPAACRDLVHRLREAQAAAGWPPETRPFAAHLTLARMLDRAERLARRLRDGDLPAAEALEPVAWEVADMALVASTTEGRGPVYRVLASWPLGGPAAASGAS